MTRPSAKYLVLLAIGTCTFMAALDGSIVNIVLPVIAASLHADIEAVSWVSTVFLLVISGFMLAFGRLGDLRGHRRVYLSGFGIFIVASGLCGVAPTVTLLVGARALQGVGGAMIYANSAAILTRNFPARERGRALGLQASLTYLGLTVGPTLGGWLAGAFSWRAVFYVNLPVGALAWTLSYALIPRDEARTGSEPFDVAGGVTFLLGLVALLVALDQGHAWGWTSGPILGLGTVSLVLLGAFLVIERRTRAPMLDLDLFRVRTFWASTASALANYVALTTLAFLLPFYLIDVRHLAPAHAGTLLSVQPIVMMIAAPAAGILSDRIAARILSTIGMTVLGLGLAGFATIGPATPAWQIGLLLAVCGLGTGTFISPNNNALMGSAPRERQGIAAGILATARNTGQMLGVALAGAVYTTALAFRHASDPGGAPFTGLSISFGVATAIAAVGVVTSAVRGDRRERR